MHDCAYLPKTLFSKVMMLINKLSTAHDPSFSPTTPALKIRAYTTRV